MNTQRPFLLAVLCAAGALSWGRDFPEPFAALDPLYSVDSSSAAFLPAAHAEFGYVDHALEDSAADEFDVRGLAAFTVYQHRGRFALGTRWASYVLVGPLGPNDTSPTVARWWMNAAEYEYGLSSAYALGRAHLLAEYSRTSQHPWRPEVAQPTTDAVKAGLGLNSLRLGPVRADLRCMAGYVDLFDFWGSSVPKPRASWMASPAARGSWPLGFGLSLYASLQADCFLLRRGGADADFWGELGLEAAGGKAAAQFYLDWCRTGDSGEMLAGSNRANLLGFGLRLGM